MNVRPTASGRSKEDTAAARHRGFEARVLLELKVSAHAELVLEADQLRVRAAFGELSIPYTQIQRVKQGVPSNVALEVAGARVWFDVVKSSQLDELLAQVEQRVRAARARAP